MTMSAHVSNKSDPVIGVRQQALECPTEFAYAEEEHSDDIEGCDAGIYTELAMLPPRTLITEDGLARLFGKGCRETVKRAIERGELPRPVRLMGRNTWTIDIIVNHIEDRLAAEARKFARASG